MNSAIQRTIDIATILLVPLVYSILSKRSYAEALGYSAVGGLFGMAIYYLLSKIKIVKTFQSKQSTLRKYAIGCAIFSAIGVPTFIAQAESRRKAEGDQFEVGAAIGRAAGSCEIAKYIKQRYCSTFTIPNDMESVCADHLASIIPPAVKGDANRLLQSEHFGQEVRTLQAQTDQGFALGKSKGIPLPELCSHYQQLIVDTYKQSAATIARSQQ